MPMETVVEGLGRLINRREILVRVGAGTLAGVLGLMGSPGTASATVDYHCCQLCFWPTGPNCGDCGGCFWCWYCMEGATTWRCCECRPNPCDARTCTGVTCSWAEIV